MTLNHRYRYECDSFRLLIDEFENQAENYKKRNIGYDSEIKACDHDEYQAPKYISNYKSILTSTLIVEAQALLDFFLPLMILSVAKNKIGNISSFDKSWKGGNVLNWTKHVLKDELCLSYNFGEGPHCKLKEFYEIRNDQIHYGGYVSSEKNKSILKGKSGISACEISGLYIVEFSYCRMIINEIEQYFSEIHECIKA